jgi:hypothetical protein
MCENNRVLWRLFGLSIIGSLQSVEYVPYFSRITAYSSLISRPRFAMRGSSERSAVPLKCRRITGWSSTGSVREHGLVERTLARAHVRIIGCGALNVYRDGIEAQGI